MTLKYVEPKPIISYTGIELDKNKEDKSYTYDDKHEFSHFEIMDILEKYCENFNEFMHVLHSLQGSLAEKKFPIDTKLDVILKAVSII